MRRPLHHAVLVNFRRRYRGFGPVRFVLRLSGEAAIAAVVVYALLYPRGLGRLVSRSEFVEFAAIAPLYETVLLQMIPVVVCRWLRPGSLVLPLVASSLAFAALHIPIDGLRSFLHALVGGVYFSATYMHWLRRSVGAAFFTTAAVHGLVNVLLMVVFWWV